MGPRHEYIQQWVELGGRFPGKSPSWADDKIAFSICLETFQAWRYKWENVFTFHWEISRGVVPSIRKVDQNHGTMAVH